MATRTIRRPLGITMPRSVSELSREVEAAKADLGARYPGVKASEVQRAAEQVAVLDEKKRTGWVTEIQYVREKSGIMDGLTSSRIRAQRRTDSERAKRAGEIAGILRATHPSVANEELGEARRAA